MEVSLLIWRNVYHDTYALLSSLTNQLQHIGTNIVGGDMPARSLRTLILRLLGFVLSDAPSRGGCSVLCLK